MKSSSEVIAGVGLADRPRKSAWPARMDLAQSASGLVLGLFMWGHMAFVSTILISNDAMWMVTKAFEGHYIFGRSFQQLLPVFASDVLDAGESGLGLLMAAPGAGTLIGAIAIGAMGDIRRKGVVLFVAMVLFSATLVLFSVSRSFLLSLALLTLAGAAMITFSSMLMTMLQLSAPGAMRGRVMSLVTVTMQGFAPLGALITGAVATAVVSKPVAKNTSGSALRRARSSACEML